MYQNFEWISSDQTQVADGQTFMLEASEVCPELTYSNRPYSIECIVAEFEITLAVTGTAIDGRDVPELMLGNVTIMQTDKTARYSAVDGDAIRLAGYDKAGPNYYEECQTLPVLGATLYRIRVPIWFNSPEDYAEEDFGMPRELFESFKFTGFTAARARGGGTVVMSSTTKIRFLVQGRERTYALCPATDTIEMPTFTQELQAINGRIGGLGIYVRGTGGGASLANLTSFSVREFNNIVFTPAQLAAFHRLRRGQVFNTPATSPGALTLREDPFGNAAPLLTATAPKCAAITLADKKRGIKHRPEVSSLNIKVVEASALTKVLYKRTINKFTTKAWDDLVRRYGAPGANGNGPATVRTLDRTARDPGEWPGFEGWLPLKWNVPGLIRAR